MNTVRNIQIHLQLENLAKDPASGYKCVVCVHAGGSGMIKQSTSRYSNASCSPTTTKKTPLALLPLCRVTAHNWCQNERGLV